jgi:drug/metabolite transporter (DMT)-like permease
LLKSESTKVILGYILICIIWGSTWLAIKIGLESIPPFLGAAFRFLVATIVLFVIVSARKITIPRDKLSIRLYLLVGSFSFSTGYALVYWGQQFVPSALASILFGTFPFFVAALSWFVFKSEYLTLLKGVGVVLGFIGIVIIFSEDVTGQFGEATTLGMSFIVLSAVVQATASVTVKKYGYELSTYALNAVGMAIGTCILFLISIATEDWSTTVFDVKAVGSVLYLGTFGSVVTFGIMFWLLKRMEAVILSLSAFITPIIALLLGIFLAGEEFTRQLFLGSVFVLFGILIANLQGLFHVIKRKRR